MSQNQRPTRIRSMGEVMLLADLDRHEFGDAPGVSERVDKVFGCPLAHGQCQVAFEGCLDGASIDPLDVFHRASTTNQLHQEFCVFHSLLCCLDNSAEKESLHR